MWWLALWHVPLWKVKVDVICLCFILLAQYYWFVPAQKRGTVTPVDVLIEGDRKLFWYCKNFLWVVCVCFFLAENLWLVIQKVSRCLFSFSYDTPHCLCSRKHDIAVIARNELFTSGLHSELASEGRNSWQRSSNCIVVSLAVSLDIFFSSFANPNSNN